MNLRPVKRLDLKIGERVDQRLTEVGMTKAEFGRRIDTSRQNVNTLLGKGDWNADLLLRACRVLECDFFAPIAETHLSPQKYKTMLRPESPGKKELAKRSKDDFLLQKLLQALRQTLDHYED